MLCIFCQVFLTYFNLLFMILPVFSVYADMQYKNTTPYLIGLAIGIYGFTTIKAQVRIKCSVKTLKSNLSNLAVNTCLILGNVWLSITILTMYSMPITTDIVSSNLDQGEVYKVCDKVCQWLAAGRLCFCSYIYKIKI
jgi:hypothetical protein